MGRLGLYAVFLTMLSSNIGSASKSSSTKWCVKVDVALSGALDGLNVTKTQKLCHMTCIDSGWCKSSNYEMASGTCELITVSHCDNSRSLVPRKGWVYSYSKKLKEEPTGARTGCSDNIEPGYPILKTLEECPKDNFTQARELCSAHNMQLCSLAQLKDAYDAGYREKSWCFYDTPLRDARVASCGQQYYDTRGECYFKVNGDPVKSLIPNTPRPYEKSNVFCCLSNN